MDTNIKNIEEIHANTMQNLQKIHHILTESEQQAQITSQQLQTDKEKLLKIKKSTDEVNETVNWGRRIIAKINRKEDKNKIIVGGVAALVAGAAITAGVLIKK
jgi:hypothetical protein